MRKERVQSTVGESADDSEGMLDRIGGRIEKKWDGLKETLKKKREGFLRERPFKKSS